MNIQFVVVINLDEDTERLARASAQLRRQGLSFSRFSGFRGRNIPEKWRPQFDDRGSIGSGEVGCYASHLQVMADMLDTDDRVRVILEDDAILSPQFGDLLRALPAHLPDDWDIVRFSSWLKHPVIRVATLPHGFGVFSYSRIPTSAVGYMINRRFAALFTQPRKRNVPLDGHFQHPSMFGDFTAYGVEPSPVRYVETEPSSIAAEGRTKHRASRLRRSRLLQSEIHAMRTHGFRLRMTCHMRRLRLGVASKGPYGLRELEVT